MFTINHKPSLRLPQKLRQIYQIRTVKTFGGYGGDAAIEPVLNGGAFGVTGGAA